MFASAYQRFLTTLLRPLDPRSDRVIISRGLFAYALRGLYEYAAQGRDLANALTSNQSLTQLMDAWRGIYGDELTLAHALEATWLIEHMLRPLSAEPVKADIVHASMNGLCMLVAMAAKWRYGTPVVMSEHGIYLRERYLSYLDDNAPHAVKVVILSFFRALAGAGVPDRRRAGAAFQLQPPLAAAGRCQPGAHLGDVQGPARRVPHRRVGAEEPTIVFMGRLDPLEDLHTLIKAFALVREEVPNARLRVYGGTPAGNEDYRDSCVRLIDELGLGGAAVLEGRVDSPINAYHAGSIVALTSISEGFPYTVVEAMSAAGARWSAPTSEGSRKRSPTPASSWRPVTVRGRPSLHPPAARRRPPPAPGGGRPGAGDGVVHPPALAHRVPDGLRACHRHRRGSVQHAATGDGSRSPGPGAAGRPAA